MHRCSWSAPRSFVLAVGSLVLSTELPGAQSPRLSVSTTANVAPAASPIGAIDDAALSFVGDGAPVRPQFAAGNWLATAHFEPADIDGFARRPGFAPGSAASMAFSLLSNEGGFLDGDVITFLPGSGAEVLVFESQITAALGRPEANIDLDAISFDDRSRLYFSLQADLTGTSVGDVADGDVLRLDGPNQVSVVFTESVVQNQFTAATGLSDSIGDVQGLEWVGGEVWVVTQAPSSHDGAVFRAVGTPAVLLDEGQVGLGGAELDAIAFARPADEILSFTLSATSALPGEVVQVEAYGDPGELLLVLPAGQAGYIDFSAFPGFGGFYLHPMDPWLSQALTHPTSYFVTLDGSGRYSTTWTLPVASMAGMGPGGEGWSVQVVGISQREPSAPWRVTRL